jgi:hypothetical protein
MINTAFFAYSIKKLAKIINRKIMVFKGGREPPFFSGYLPNIAAGIKFLKIIEGRYKSWHTKLKM